MVIRPKPTIEPAAGSSRPNGATHVPDFFTEEHFREAHMDPTNVLARIASIWKWRGRNTLYPDVVLSVDDLCELGAERLMQRVRGIGTTTVKAIAKILLHFHFVLRP